MNQMANRGKGHLPPHKGTPGRISSSPIIDDEGFTMVTPKQFFKRGGHLGSSSSSHQKSKQKTPNNKEKQIPNKETLANIVAKNENDEYISKNYPVHICYIEQEDFHLIENPWAIRAKYLNSFQSRIQSGKSRIYFENILDQIENSSMGNDSEDNEVLAGEGQEPEDEDISLEDMESQDEQLANFMASLDKLKK
ncbi:Pre-mRNA-splicing factor like [Actinidia chinensis var. chinensis]|uniref:Pre-mRNA-splicing factor like n=1 Tax=Actinidia chinensis var. chinensis TaxID=1590841 RepID=A0A2R6QXW0_ACTCC|nr:Pre-mRNA-splicing factor like [Actinidia chinensis var. chinensis]